MMVYVRGAGDVKAGETALTRAKRRETKLCEGGCGAHIPAGKLKRFCLGCYDIRLQANIVAGRIRRKKAKA